VKVVKNKIAAPFRMAEFDITSAGISREGGIVDVGVEMNIISKSGAFYRYNDEMLGQGKAATIIKLKENLAMQKEIVARIMAENKDGRAPLIVGAEDTDETGDNDTALTDI
jgi:recombination protein RecA